MTTDLPDDENGDVLRRMREGGDDPTVARDINYSVVFEEEAAAARFVHSVRELGFEVQMELLPADGEDEAAWDVTVKRFMLPDHGEITAFEATLESIATPLGGSNDGWGCFRQIPNA